MADIRINEYTPSALGEATERARVAETLRQKRLSILDLRRQIKLMSGQIEAKDLEIRKMRGLISALDGRIQALENP